MFYVSFNIFFEIDSPTYLRIICIDKTFHEQFLINLYRIVICFPLSIIKVNHRPHILFKSLPRRIINPRISIGSYTNSIRVKETFLPLRKLLFRLNRDKQLEHLVAGGNPISMLIRFNQFPHHRRVADVTHLPDDFQFVFPA